VGGLAPHLRQVDGLPQRERLYVVVGDVHRNLIVLETARLKGYYYVHICITCLKGQCHKIFRFWFFHESASPKPFRIFFKLAKIFADQGAPEVSLTPVANEKIFNQKSFNYFFASLGSKS
jgi:hypothetical protein